MEENQNEEKSCLGQFYECRHPEYCKSRYECQEFTDDVMQIECRNKCIELIRIYGMDRFLLATSQAYHTIMR